MLSCFPRIINACCRKFDTSWKGSSEKKYPFSLQFDVKNSLLANIRPGEFHEKNSRGFLYFDKQTVFRKHFLYPNPMH